MESKTGKPAGKAGSYFKYAIGEIILVVIGILIALQINNWNEERKELKRSKDFLTEFKKDLEKDTLGMNRVIKLVKKRIEIEKWALQRINYTPTQVDSLHSAIYTNYFNWNIETRTLRKIENAGITGLKGYDSIFNALSYYYDITNYRLNNSNNEDKEKVRDGLLFLEPLKDVVEIKGGNLPWEELDSFPTITSSDDRNDLLIKFGTSVRGRNLLREQYLRHLKLLEKFQSVKKQATLLIKSIEKELGK
jgi:hypothetical protein